MKNKIHYAWVICLATALMMFVSYGILANVFTVYVPTIVADNGFSYAQGTNLSSIRNLSALVTALFVHVFIEKLGVKRLCAVSIALMVISRILFAIGGSYIIYVLGTVIAGICYIISGIVPTSILIGNWFESSRNLALGLTSAGSGLANIFLSPLITAGLARFNLRTTFAIEGALILVFGIFILFILRNSPSDCGLSIYKTNANQKSTIPASKENASISSPAWYLVLFACFLFASPASAGFLNLTVLFDSFGYESSAIGWFISFLGLTMILGKILMGKVYDLLGGFKTNFIVGAASGSSMFIFAFCLDGVSPVFPMLGISALGFGVIFSTITQPVWARDLMGNKGFSKALSQLSFAFTLGSVAHNYVTSLIVGKTDSYVPAYILCLACVIVGMIILQSVYFHAGARENH